MLKLLSQTIFRPRIPIPTLLTLSIEKRSIITTTSSCFAYSKNKNNFPRKKKKRLLDMDNLFTGEDKANSKDDPGFEFKDTIPCTSETDEKQDDSIAKGLYHADSPLYKRQWRSSKLGQRVQKEGLKPHASTFSVMTYNVLSQDLLEQHPDLYKENNSVAIQWSYRHPQIIREITGHLPDVLCLQEVQATHLKKYFEDVFTEHGYKGIYKKRTSDKVDGCAIYWNKNKFKLIEETTVEYYQPGVNILNRDNIAIIVRLQVQDSDEEIVFATTHLLYNPRRTDIRLAQAQILLAELDRVSHISGDKYLPVILTGDFNLEPHTSVYDLITTGQCNINPAFTKIPQYLGITDCCRHSNVLHHRETNSYDKRDVDIVTTEMKNISLYHSERKNTNFPDKFPSHHKFGTGSLNHQLKLKSVYEHFKNIRREEEDATTHQDDWVTVDYIFYSANKAVGKRNLNLLSRWSLPNVRDCNNMGPVPNLDAPSDHFPLVACFIFS